MRPHAVQLAQWGDDSEHTAAATSCKREPCTHRIELKKGNSARRGPVGGGTHAGHRDVHAQNLAQARNKARCEGVDARRASLRARQVTTRLAFFACRWRGACTQRAKCEVTAEMGAPFLLHRGKDVLAVRCSPRQALRNLT